MSQLGSTSKQEVPHCQDRSLHTHLKQTTSMPLTAIACFQLHSMANAARDLLPLQQDILLFTSSFTYSYGIQANEVAYTEGLHMPWGARLKDQCWRVRLNSRPVFQQAIHGLLCVHQVRRRERIGVEITQQKLALWLGDILKAVDGHVWRSGDALQEFLGFQTDVSNEHLQLFAPSSDQKNIHFLLP